MEEAPVETTAEVGQDAPSPDVPYGMIGGGGAVLVLLAVVAIVFARSGRSTPSLDADEPVSIEAARDPAPPTDGAPTGLASRLRAALGRSRGALQGRFDTLFGRSSVDEELFEELEETLLAADAGLPTTERILAPLRERAKAGEDDPAVLREALRTDIRGMLQAVHQPLSPRDGLWVVLVVGVNGSGKTTTIGKLAARLVGQGRKVILAAGDTYRAAAAEQLEVWAERAGADIVRHQEGADPGAVVFDALEAAQARGHDVVLIDTAGRLQTRKPLMDQLAKMRRVIRKHVPDGPHETLLVIDGTMGQNAMSQAKLFHEATPLTGVAVTKLDGTAKGGMVLAIASDLQVPVKLIGIGEQVDDLRDFEPSAFVEALC